MQMKTDAVLLATYLALGRYSWGDNMADVSTVCGNG